MDESNAMRAITVGVSVFIAIITIGGILTYYSIARNMAARIGGGNDVGQKYSEEIEDILIKGSYKGTNSEYLTGTEVRNLINYFYKNENVSLDVELDISSSSRMVVKNINNNESFLIYLHYYFLYILLQ